MFNVKFKRMRKKLGMTQVQLAKKLGISPSAVGMYEQGRREPDSEMLLKISNFFNVSVDFFLESKKSKRRLKNAEEITKKIRSILSRSANLKDGVNKQTLKAITEAVKQGLKEALEEDN